MPKKCHIVFLEDLQTHSVREACLGAAEYAADRPHWDFDPWPVIAAQSKFPAPDDLRHVDGILTTEPAIKRVFGNSARTRIPRVYFLADLQHARVPYVSLDENAIGTMAAEHLWLRGYRHFAFIGSESLGWSRQRYHGFNAALATSGASISSRIFSEDILPVFWSWGTTRRNQHLHRTLAALPKPCGIFAANDVIACFVIQAARQGGYRIPEDIGVVGVDDDPVPNAASGLAISSIRPPFREVGRAAARLLDEWILGNHSLPKSIRMPPIRVAVRTSTDAFMTEDSLVGRAQSYIESRRHERILVEEVVRAVGSNRVTVGKRFRRHLDAGLMDYIRRRRIEYAREQILGSRLSVEEISRRCGFSSSSYFSRVFEEVTGVRPGRLQRELAGRT